MRLLIQKEDIDEKEPFGAIIVVFICIVGIGLRLFHFIYNRSLWGDESLLSINILNKSFIQLAHFPLDLGQFAPLGFLWIQRLNTYLLGNSEMVLRLFPLMCGISSIFLFWNLCCKLTLTFWEKIGGFTCFAFNAPIIYYSVEAKQYETELMVTLLSFLAYFRFRDKSDMKSAIWWGIYGATCLWFSFSSIFILTVIGIMQTWKVFRNRYWISWIVTACFWFVNFSVIYLYFISAGTKSQYLNNYWVDNFFPLLTHSSDIGIWAFNTTEQILDNPVGMAITLGGNFALFYKLLSILLIIGGMFIFYRKSKQVFLLFTLPAVLVLMASALEKYPIYQRFILFYVPVLLLFLGTSCGAIVQYLKTKVLRHFLLRYFVVGVLLFPLIFYSLYLIYKPSSIYNYFETREALLLIEKEYQSGDLVLIDNELTPIYGYYNQLRNLKMDIMAVADPRSRAYSSESLPDPFTNQISKLKQYKRVWFMVRPTNILIEDVEVPAATTLAFIPYTLNRIGTQLQEKNYVRTKLMLYQLK